MATNVNISLSVVMLMITLSVNTVYASAPQSYDLVVLEDRGGVSIQKYLPKNSQLKERATKNFYERKSKKLVNAHFPVRTTRMTVGKVTEDEAKEIKYEMTARPLFIIGDDPVSINWLKANKSLLVDKKAIGFVVNVESEDRLNALLKVADYDLLLQATPGDNLAKYLEIKHYPFYMDRKGVLR